MHELSIALSIIDGVEEQAAHRPAARVSAVYVKLGPLSGVVKDALLFSWEAACAGTPLEQTRLEVEEILVRLYCTRCAGERPAAGFGQMVCAECGELCFDIRSGAELEVVAMELED